MKRISKSVSTALTVAMLSTTLFSSAAFFGTQQAMAASSPLITGAETHSLYLKPNGTVWSWGTNASGELGDGSKTASNTPVKVAGLSGVTAVESLFTPAYSLALKQDGTVWHWGYTKGVTPSQILELSDIRAISAKDSFVMALKGDGTVYAYGTNTSGALGNNSTSTSWAWLPNKVMNLTAVTDIEAANATAYALKADGTLWAWGLNANGELGDGTTASKSIPQQVGLSGVRSIAAGAEHAVAVKSDGTVWAWGLNTSGQVGDGTTATRFVPTQIHALTGVRSVASGESHNLALKEDGTVWAWGSNGYGQLGDNTTDLKTLPVQVPGLTGVVAISAGKSHSFAIKSDGTVWAWGLNTSGQLGDKTNTNKKVPVEVTGIFNLSLSVGATRATSVDLAYAGTEEVTRYVVKRGNVMIYEGANTRTTDTGLTPGSMYTYTVEAYDASNKLLESRMVTVYTTQFELNVSASATSDSTATLTYSANNTIGNYVVKRNGLVVYSGTETTFNDVNLTAGQTYTYNVEAYDANYNLLGSRTVNVEMTSSTTNPPADSMTLYASATPMSSSAVYLQFSATGSSVSKYVVNKGNSTIFQGQGTTYVDANLTANTLYTYVIEAQDANGAVLATKTVTATTLQMGTYPPGGGTYPPGGGTYPPGGYYPPTGYPSSSPMIVLNIPIYLPYYPSVPQYQQYQPYPQYQPFTQYQQYPQYQQPIQPNPYM